MAGAQVAGTAAALTVSRSDFPRAISIDGPREWSNEQGIGSRASPYFWMIFAQSAYLTRWNDKDRGAGRRWSRPSACRGIPGSGI